MAIDVTCGECGKQYRASDDGAGKRFRCRLCGGMVNVPIAPPDEEDNPFAIGPPDDAPEADEEIAARAVQIDASDAAFHKAAPKSPMFSVTRDDRESLYRALSRYRAPSRPVPAQTYEPWYYRFLAGYAVFLSGLGIAQFILALGYFLLTVISGRAANEMMDESDFRGLILTLCYSGGCLLLALLVSAPILLFVDIGRSVRTSTTFLEKLTRVPRT
jgi:hypothetical protein